jgi:hypothetical protein
MGMASLGIASLAMLGGSALGGAVGSLLAGYALLLGVGALYLFATLTVQERAVQRVRGRHPLPTSASLRAHGHRVF